MRQNFMNAIDYLSSKFLDRTDVIRGLFIGLIAGEDVFIIGPPGTAKTQLVHEFSKIINGRYWQHLLTKFSTPEEVFGPLSLKGLKNDIYEHVGTNTIQDCHIAFLDEVFKANSSILNSLLEVMNERIYTDGATRKPLPLQLLVGASNEMPDSRDLEAVYDRYLLRYAVDYLDHGHWLELIRQSRVIPQMPSITMQEVELVRADAMNIPFSQAALDVMSNIKITLQREGVVGSDRRWMRALRAMRADAWLSGNTKVLPDNLHILSDMMWKSPTDIIDVKHSILKIAAPVRAKVNSIVDRGAILKETAPKWDSNNLKFLDEDGKEMEMKEGMDKTMGALTEIRSGLKELQSLDQTDPYIKGGIEKLSGLQSSIQITLQECLGVQP